MINYVFYRRHLRSNGLVILAPFSYLVINLISYYSFLHVHPWPLPPLASCYQCFSVVNSVPHTACVKICFVTRIGSFMLATFVN